MDYLNPRLEADFDAIGECSWKRSYAWRKSYRILIFFRVVFSRAESIFIVKIYKFHCLHIVYNKSTFNNFEIILLNNILDLTESMFIMLYAL